MAGIDNVTVGENNYNLRDSAAQNALPTQGQVDDIITALNTIANKTDHPYNPDNKLPSDYVNDANQTHKFATQAQLTQIETNKNNILLTADQSTKYNILPVTLNSGTISDVTFTVNADKSISTSGTASSNITNVYINISFTLPSSGEYVLFGCASGGSSASTGSYRLDMLDGGISGTQVVADTGSGAVFTPSQFQNTTACVRLRIGNGANMNGKTFKPMIIPKAIYDAGFTDYQPYAMSNVELTEQKADASDVPLKLERYVANSSKTYTITAGRVYIITVNSYGTYGMFMAFKYSDETTPRLYEIKKSSSFDSLITVTAVANSSDISIAPVSSSTWFVSSGMKL